MTLFGRRGGWSLLGKWFDLEGEDLEKCFVFLGWGLVFVVLGIFRRVDG